MSIARLQHPTPKDLSVHRPPESEVIESADKSLVVRPTGAQEGVATATGRGVTSRLDGAGLLMEGVAADRSPPVPNSVPSAIRWRFGGTLPFREGGS